MGSEQWSADGVRWRRSVRVPGFWNVDIGAIELGDGGATEETQGAVEVGAEDFDGAIDAGFSGSGEAVGVGAAAEHGASAERERLDDVGATANASVHEDFSLAVDGRDDFRQDAQGRGSAIELSAAVIGDGDGSCAFIDGAARVIGGQNALDDDRTAPEFANPGEIAPGDGGFGESNGNIDERHGAFARDDDVGEWLDASVAQKSDEPTGSREDLRKIGNFLEGVAADQLLHAVAEIALAHTGDGGIDGDNERGKASDAGAIDGGLGGGAATHEVELIEDGTGGGGFYVFKFVAGDGRENVGGARLSGGASCTDFADGVHEAAVANGSEQERESEIEAENAGAQVAMVEGDGVTRTEGEVLIDAATFAEGDLAFGAAIEVIEDGLGHAALGDGAEISDADYARRGDGTGGWRHAGLLYQKDSG